MSSQVKVALNKFYYVPFRSIISINLIDGRNGIIKWFIIDTYTDTY